LRPDTEGTADDYLTRQANQPLWGEHFCVSVLGGRQFSVELATVAIAVIKLVEGSKRIVEIQIPISQVQELISRFPNGDVALLAGLRDTVFASLIPIQNPLYSLHQQSEFQPADIETLLLGVEQFIGLARSNNDLSEDIIDDIV